VHIGITLPSFVASADRDAIRGWCRRIEAGPFSSVSVGERIAFPSHELITTLAFAAAATERVRILPTVGVLPTHETVRFAKQMATVDVLSGGRLTVGVGVGGREDDYRAVGAPFAGRFARLDEQVTLMRRVWRGEVVVDGLPPVGPEPVQPGGPPILSAAMGPKSMARTATWADGIAGFDLAPDPAGVDGLFRRAEAAWVEAGRTDRPWLATSTWFALGPGAEERLRGYACNYLSNFGDRTASSLATLCRLSDPGVLRERVAAIADTGCDELILVPTTDDVAEIDRLLAALS